MDLREVPTAARLPLDKILPPATLPAPTTAPAGPERPPLEALTLYAEACDNLLAHRRLAAITLLEKAVALDPGSFELHAALGRAYLGSGGTDPRSISEMERAAEIDPDHVELQTDLGRQYLALGDTAKAPWHLRLRSPPATTPPTRRGRPSPNCSPAGRWRGRDITRRRWRCTSDCSAGCATPASRSAATRK